MLTDAELQEIRDRAEKATPGPWEGHDTCDAVTSGTVWVIDTSQEGYVNHDDTDFIAHAREDVPKLLAEIDRLRTLLGLTVSTMRDDLMDQLSHEPQEVERIRRLRRSAVE